MSSTLASAIAAPASSGRRCSGLHTGKQTAQSIICLVGEISLTRGLWRGRKLSIPWTLHATDSSAEGLPDSVASSTWQEAEKDDGRSFSDAESGHRTVTLSPCRFAYRHGQMHVMAAPPTVAHLAGVQLRSLSAPKGLHMLTHVFHGASEAGGNNIILKSTVEAISIQEFRVVWRGGMESSTCCCRIESPTTSTVSLSVLGHSYGRSLHALWLMALIKRWTCTSHNKKT